MILFNPELGDKGVYTFPESINPKINDKGCVVFERVFFKTTFQHINHAASIG